MRAVERSNQVKKAMMTAIVVLVAGGVFAAAPAAPTTSAPKVAGTAPEKPAVKPAVAPEKAAAAPAAAPVAAAQPAPALSATPAAVEATATVTGAPAPAVRIEPVKDEYKAFKIPVEPYYSFNWTEAVTFPSVGDWFVGANFATSLGGKYVINPEHALLGMYDLQYKGPGLKTQEGREFAERSMDHNLMLEHHWSVMPGYKVRTRGLFMTEMRRTGSNEVWGKGLYDFRVFGGGIVQDFNVMRVTDLSFEVTYQYFSFPNYTDLLQEFQAAGLSSELSGGQQDYNNIRFRLDGKFMKIGSAWIGWNIQSYVNAKIVEEGGVYSDKKQMDNTIELGTAWDVELLPPAEGSKAGQVATTPSVKLDFKRSNQNFLRFKYFGDTNPVFVPKNYNYSAVELSSPFRWVYSVGDTGGASSLFFSPTWMFTAYTDRPHRDKAGDYQKGAQWTSIVVLTPGITMSMSRFSAMTLGYSYQLQSSNTKFEKFIPYNFFGHTVFMSYDINF
jgi:hypothetical protein